MSAIMKKKREQEEEERAEFVVLETVAKYQYRVSLVTECGSELKGETLF